MKIPSLEPAFLIFVAFFTLQIFAVTINGDESFIITSCKRTRLSDYCIAVLESDRRSFSADLLGLVKISVDHSYANATDTYKFINEKLLPNATDPPMLRECLVECAHVYDLGAYDLFSSLDLLDKRDYDGADQAIGGGVEISFGCQDVFNQFNVPIPPSLAF